MDRIAPSDALETTVRDIAAALALSHHIPPTPGTAPPSWPAGTALPYGALTAGERAVRQAYVARERSRRSLRRRSALARTLQSVIPVQRPAP